jgi:hypothetical protein
MPSRIGDYSGTTSSPAERGFRYAQLAYLRQPRQSLKLGYSYPYQCFPIFFVCHFSLTYFEIKLKKKKFQPNLILSGLF